jgi:hypothetical protein
MLPLSPLLQRCSGLAYPVHPVSTALSSVPVHVRGVAYPLCSMELSGSACSALRSGCEVLLHLMFFTFSLSY